MHRWPGTVIPVLADLAPPHAAVTVLAVHLLGPQIRVLLHAADGATAATFALAAADLVEGADLDDVRAVAPVATAVFSRAGRGRLALRAGGSTVALEGRAGGADLAEEEAVLAALGQPTRVQWVRTPAQVLTRPGPKGTLRCVVQVVARSAEHLLVACSAPHQLAELAHPDWPPTVWADGEHLAPHAVHVTWLAGHVGVVVDCPAPPPGCRRLALGWGDDRRSTPLPTDRTPP